ncbi:hypothetical protein [Cellulomonas sp.]|uniref:hypothetical protein n=1 Tax=Cellulomonas sp. TaxID=40001 RepID=UPI001AFDCD9A|nr:hypothetical protein [Cellulomonas sp.]MBO9555574.1 hypothetical protein [Cellulomonas sp.]
MTLCPECGRIGGTHKMDCSRRPGRADVVPSTSSATAPDIDLTAAIDAAHAATCRVPDCTASYDATAMVRAALPHIERQVREQERERIAREIEAPMRRHDAAQVGFSAVGDAYAHAARIARGES